MPDRAVHMYVCGICGNHGFFMFPSGKRSFEFTNAPEAKVTITVAIREQEILESEAAQLIVLIEAIGDAMENNQDEEDKHVQESEEHPICPMLAQVSDMMAGRTLN